MIPEWKLAHTNLYRAKRRKYEVAILPTSAVEPHNLHLPQGQDFMHTTWISEKIAQLAWPRCESVLCLPTLPYGVDCNLMAFPLAIHVSQQTLDSIVKDIIVSLTHHGIGKILILNGHGGNDFGPFVRQVQCDLNIHVFVCNWWTVGSDRYSEIFDTPDDHAGELETSVALHLYPELVEMENAAEARQRPFRFEALRKGWARTSRDFSRMNEFCANGIPASATAEKGQKYLDLVCGRIADFVVELATTPIDETFPHSATEQK